MTEKVGEVRTGIGTQERFIAILGHLPFPWPVRDSCAASRCIRQASAARQEAEKEYAAVQAAQQQAASEKKAAEQAQSEARATSQACSNRGYLFQEKAELQPLDGCRACDGTSCTDAIVCAGCNRDLR